MTDDLLKDPLAAAMTREAARLTPAFSDALHGRVMNAVNSAPLIESTTHRMSLGRRVSGSRAVPWSLAAAVVLAVGIWRLRPPARPENPSFAVAPIPTRPPDPVAASPGPMENRVPAVTPSSVSLPDDLGSQQLAQLNHDAHFALGLVLSPLAGTSDVPETPDETQPSR